MIKKIALACVVLSLTTSCVSKKIYQDLENKYADLKKEHNALSDENGTLKTDKNQLELDGSVQEKYYSGQKCVPCTLQLKP